jgi:uncharacterized lipoprotein YmbA
MTRLRRTAILPLVLLASGCSILAPLPNPNRFYTLAALPGTDERPVAGAGTTMTYGLGPISLPLYLDRNEIATRISPTEITYSDTDRWAEPLKGNVTRVLAQNLSMLTGATVITFPWPLSPGVDYQIEITFLRFDREASGTTHLAARWTIRDARNGTDVTTGETRSSITTEPSDTAAGVAALSRALNELSEEVAAALRILPRPVTP